MSSESKALAEFFLKDKKIVVVGQGFTVGQPLSRILKNKGYNGVYLSTLGWEHKLPEIIEGI